MATRPDLSRRQFLAHSAGLASASLALGASREGGVRGDAIRAGFVGLGDRGRRLLGATLATPGVRVVALCDVDPSRLKRALDIFDARDAQAIDSGAVSADAATHAAPGGARRGRRGPRGYTDARLLFEASDVDAVVIATPSFLHREQTLAALAAGKHVYCEKPMALAPADCTEVLAACRAAEVRGQVYQGGLQRRYSPRYRDSVAFVRSGEAGEILFVRAQWHAVGASRSSKPWVHRRDRSGDIVVEQGTHQFDVFDWVLGGPPLAAVAMGGRSHPSTSSGLGDVLDHYGATIEYPGGVKVQLSHLTHAIPDRRFAGVYELAFCEQAGVDLGNALAWDATGRARELSAARGSDTQLAVAAFFESVATGRRPLADAQTACRATLAALLCQRAIDTGRRVTWDEIETA